MSESVDFDRFIRPLSPRLWSASAHHRAYTYHGTGRCPQPVHPLSPRASRSVSCAECTEFHQQHLLVAHKRVSATLSRSGGELGSISGPVPVSEAMARSWALDARNELDAQRGRAVNISKLPNAQWFRRACPGSIDQEVVTALLFFVRSNDVVRDGGIFPVELWADRLGITVDEVQRRIAACLARIAEHKPGWVERNVESPLSERLAAAQALDLSEYRDAEIAAR